VGVIIEENGSIEMNANRKIVSYGKTGVMIVAVAAVLFSIGAGLKFVLEKENQKKIAQLEESIYNLNSAIHLDTIRQYNIQKIISIINDFNPGMPMNQKYEIAEEIYQMSLKYDNLNVDLICATITHESAGTWNPEIVSPAGAMGLMQIMPNTGLFVAAYEGLNWSSPEEILFNPIYNIRIGSRYLSSLIELYDVDGGLAAYNGGEKRAALWIGSGKAHGILATETQHYVPAIQRLYEEFQSMKL
jgi:soluble lytic murein transglycosylase